MATNRIVAFGQEDDIRGVRDVRAQLVSVGCAPEALRLPAQVAVSIAGPIK